MEKNATPLAGTPVFDRYAIIATGGKQYQAIEGKTLQIELIDGKPGDKVEFSNVLLRKTGASNIEIGRPYLTQPVTAEILKEVKGEKVIAFRFKRRHKVRVKRGHRQNYTVVRITTI